jgi:hypothetical protein
VDRILPPTFNIQSQIPDSRNPERRREEMNIRIVTAAFLTCFATTFSPLIAQVTSDPSQKLTAETEVTTDRVYPPSPQLTAAQREAMLERYEAREAAESFESLPLIGPPGRPLVHDADVPVIHLADAAISSGPPPLAGDFVIGRTVINTSLPTEGGAQVAEPQTSNMGLHAFYLNNTQADFTTDGGATFTSIDLEALRKPPIDASVYCCDSNVVYDPSHSMWIVSRLYMDGPGTHGVIQLSVIKNTPELACTRYIDPDINPNDNNILPDYPQLGLSDNYLYITTSEIKSGVWYRDKIRRGKLDDVAACSFPFEAISSLNGGVKRVWTPVRGAHEIMYWAQFENNTQLRIYSWPESVRTSTSVLKTVQATTFADSDCSGGNNNKDWIASKGWGIGEGFMRGAMARGGVGSTNPEESRLQFYWNGGADSAHPQAYIRSAVFQLPALTLLDEPNISNSDFCYSYADVHPNARGDLGLTLAFGGKKGGSGPGLSAGVAIEDEYTTGYKIDVVHETTAGTDMPTSQRYGDYLSIKPDQPCSLWWATANYAYVGGGNWSNVVGRYVEFGRARDESCWTRWKDLVPPKLP